MSSIASKPTEKVRRVRKKSLYKSVAAQMDFYFGDSNLRRDGFMKKEIDSSNDGYIPLDLFLTFNKIIQLGVSTEDIAKAVSLFSKLLTLSEAKDKVKRTTPVSTEGNVDERIVYLEGLPSNVNHDWVTEAMTKYDKVNYVSLPRYPSTKTPKGFAFVEFDTEDGVKKCLSAIGTKEFSTVHPFPKAGSKDMQRVQKAVSRTAGNETQKKRNKKRNSAAVESSAVVSDSTNEAEPVCKKPKAETPIKSVAAPAKGDTPQTDQPHKTRKRKRKSSQSKNKDELSENKDENQPEEKVAKVVTKTETKKPKNEQSATETESISNKKEATQTPGSTLRAISKIDWQALKSQYLSLQKASMAALKQRLREQRLKEEADNETAASVNHLEIVPNVVVEIKGSSELHMDKVSACVPHGVETAYIDVRVGSDTGYIRCKSCEDASKLITETCGEDYQLSLVQGEAEKSYWEKLNQQRMEKRKKGDKKSKRSTNKKGTQKILEQHMKQSSKAKKNSHVLFDDD